MSTCTHRNCNRRPFMDTPVCFDHQYVRSTGLKIAGTAWFVLCLLLALALVAFGVWAIYTLVEAVAR